MLAALLHYTETDTLPDNLIGHLSPREPDDNNYFLRKHAGFNQREQAAILAFLETYLVLFPNEYSEANPVYRPLLDRAMEYWKQRLNSDES
jgi:hypothetical protein